MDPATRAKSLAELESGPPPGTEPYPTRLVETCVRLWSVPIGEFSVEDLRVMLGQQIGVWWLLPLALEVLEADPLAEGDMYPGDLLWSALKVAPGSHQSFGQRLWGVLGKLEAIPSELAEAVARFREAVPE